MASLRTLWSRLPLIGRLLTTATVALLAAGAVMLLVSARLEVREFRGDLAAELDRDLDTLSGVLAGVVVGVSCNPQTFARDARVLIDAGFRLERVTPVDQFLWSAHVELVSVFKR